MNMRKPMLVLMIALMTVMASLAWSGHAARAFPLQGCTTVTIDGVTHTVKVVDPTTLTGVVFASGCDYGVYVEPGLTTQFDHVVVLNATLADVVIDGSVATITNSSFALSNVGLYARNSTVSLATSTAVGDNIGVYMSHTTLTMTSNSIFDNYVGVYTYYTKVTAQNDQVHENNYFGYLVDISHATLAHERIFGNNGFGFFAFYANATISNSYVFKNGYGYKCADATFSCATIGFGGESRTLNIKFDHIYGVVSFGRAITLSHTNVDYNGGGVMAAQSSGVITLTDRSYLCTNHPGANYATFTGGLVDDINAHVCLS